MSLGGCNCSIQYITAFSSQPVIHQFVKMKSQGLRSTSKRGNEVGMEEFEGMGDGCDRNSFQWLLLARSAPSWEGPAPSCSWALGSRDLLSWPQVVPLPAKQPGEDSPDGASACETPRNSGPAAWDATLRGQPAVRINANANGNGLSQTVENTDQVLTLA